jgi:hypothetical protein
MGQFCEFCRSADSSYMASNHPPPAPLFGGVPPRHVASDARQTASQQLAIGSEILSGALLKARNATTIGGRTGVAGHPSHHRRAVRTEGTILRLFWTLGGLARLRPVKEQRCGKDSGIQSVGSVRQLWFDRRPGQRMQPRRARQGAVDASGCQQARPQGRRKGCPSPGPDSGS